MRPVRIASGLLLLLLTTSCSSISDQQEDLKPFKFRTLTLRQNNSKGEPIWQLDSPRTRYRLDSRLAKLMQPSAIFYSDGKPAYKLTAPTGLLKRDGEQIELVDGVRFRSLDDRGIEISGQSAIWRPDDDVLLLKGNPKAVNNSQEIISRNARYLINKELLELRHDIKLSQWSDKKSRTGPPQLVVTSPQLDWNLTTGALLVAGPVKGLQRPTKDRTRHLTAKSIEGNTNQNWLDFLAPVTIKEKAEGLDVLAGRSRWWTKEDRLTSKEPAVAVVKRLTIKGSGFEIWQGRQELSIDDNCELLQPDQSLSAQTCNWNWDTGEVVAQGDVELRRQQYNQVTRAQELRGVTGEEGEINFTAPGQQVQTQLDVGGSGPSSPTQQGRPSAPPVAF